MYRPNKEDRAGIYLTVIVHLAVLIVLLASGLGYSLSKETSFVMDFTELEDLERLQREIEMKEAISRKLEAELGSYNQSQSAVRNVAVDRGSLRDDRGTDADKLYEDARKLAEELRQGSLDAAERQNEEFEMAALPEKEEQKENEQQKSAYTGPSVVAYEMDGRKASKLPIPAYRCYGGGEVKVTVLVNPQGNVLSASVDESHPGTSDDNCLRAYAVRAAKLARFSAKADAAPKQSGYIIYKFIAQ